MAYLISRTDVNRDAKKAIKKMSEMNETYTPYKHITWENLKYYILCSPLWVTRTKEEAIKDCRDRNKRAREENKTTGNTVIYHFEEIAIY